MINFDTDDLIHKALVLQGGMTVKENNSGKRTAFLKEQCGEKNQDIETSLENKDSNLLDSNEKTKKSLEELGYSFEVGV
ncbi:MAG TPA: hypothetical protein PK604_02185 [Acetivibrio clariflavus]|nr:hypothetical protein [Acetivibrio clariflavus]HPU40914.1 hypothetical protein [Acetivibrio clariflavus]